MSLPTTAQLSELATTTGEYIAANALAVRVEVRQLRADRIRSIRRSGPASDHRMLQIVSGVAAAARQALLLADAPTRTSALATTGLAPITGLVR